jgi:hypothetical protein
MKERRAVVIPEDGNEWELKKVMKTGGSAFV